MIITGKLPLLIRLAKKNKKKTGSTVTAAIKRTNLIRLCNPSKLRMKMEEWDWEDQEANNNNNNNKNPQNDDRVNRDEVR